jgi:hypothetical protein
MDLAGHENVLLPLPVQINDTSFERKTIKLGQSDTFLYRRMRSWWIIFARADEVIE